MGGGANLFGADWVATGEDERRKAKDARTTGGRKWAGIEAQGRRPEHMVNPPTKDEPGAKASLPDEECLGCDIGQEHTKASAGGKEKAVQGALDLLQGEIERRKLEELEKACEVYQSDAVHARNKCVVMGKAIEDLEAALVIEEAAGDQLKAEIKILREENAQMHKALRVAGWAHRAWCNILERRRG